MFKAKLSLLIVFSIVAGCSTQPAKEQAANAATAGGPDTQCHAVDVTGSMFTKTVCTTGAQRDAQQRNVDDLRNATGAKSGGCLSPGAQQCSEQQ
jgi:hypothetical protein